MKTRKQISILLLKHFSLFALYTAIYIFSFQTALYRSVNIFFFRGILLLIFMSLLMFTSLIWFKLKKRNNFFSYYDIVLAVTIFFSINVLFFTHVPTTAERSVSIFVLGYMNKNSDKALTQKEMEEAFFNNYVTENKNIEKRFKEQETSGNVELNGGKYKITGRGILLMKFYSFIADLFGISKKNLGLN